MLLDIEKVVKLLACDVGAFRSEQVSVEVTHRVITHTAHSVYTRIQAIFLVLLMSVIRSY